MSTLNLGKIRFNWAGAYNNSTAYVANDVVSSGGNSYICILASTGNAVSNATYWSIMSSAGTNGTNGTNGTDLGTVLTTQGDVAYRDGSGLQRLAKGTAGQSLTMNSGATAPEWGSGGAFTVLADTTVSGSPNVLSFDSILTGYQAYIIHLVGIKRQSGSNEMACKFTVGGTPTNSGYTWGSMGASVGVNNYTSYVDSASSDTSIHLSNGTTPNDLSVQMYIHTSLTDSNKKWSLRYTSENFSGGHYWHGKGTYLATDKAHNGIDFYWNGTSTITHGRGIVLGLGAI